MTSETIDVSHSDEDLEVHRVPGPSYQQLLESDRYPVPEILRERSTWPTGEPHRIPRERYYAQEIHDREAPRHFERMPIDDWGTKVHAAKVLDCNWKAGLEAFIEAAHVVTTHPQSVTGNDPCNSQYDIWDNVVRIITPMGVPSVRLPRDP